MTARRALLRTIAIAMCATAGLAIVIVLSGHFDDTAWRILTTTTAISVFALLIVPASILLERRVATTLGRVSALLVGTAFALTLVLIWTVHDGTSQALWKTWGVALTLAAASAQAAAVEGRRRDADSTAVARLTTASMATGAVLAAMGVAAILATIDEGGYYRGLGALAILDVLLVALAAVLRRGSGPIGRTHRVRVDGVVVEAPGRDFAAAVAAAIRQAEKEGREVKRIERA